MLLKIDQLVSKYIGAGSLDMMLCSRERNSIRGKRENILKDLNRKKEKEKRTLKMSENRMRQVSQTG
jgi:hypothetical protein